MTAPRRGVRARIWSSRAAVAGAVIVTLLGLFALIGPRIAAHDPYASDFTHGIGPSGLPIGPSAEHLLGTDRIFRDQLARLAHGARLSLLIGLAATILATGIGATVGVLAGWYEGSEGVRVPWAVVGALIAAALLPALGAPLAALWVLVVALNTAGALASARKGNGLRGLFSIAALLGTFALTAWLESRLTAKGTVSAAALLWVLPWRLLPEKLLAGPKINLDFALMRAVDIGLSFPFLLLVMAIGAALDRTTVVGILAVLGLTGWLGTARILRAKTMQVRNLDYVVASRALGQATVAILWKHVLPNVSGPLLVTATVSVAQMIVAESVLSYLGVGVSPPTATWGHMLYEGQDVYQAAPWLVAGPAAAILLAAAGFNLLGEGLRDALDPQED